jgi:hypothetical protein
MFGLFKKKSEEEILHRKYKELMKDAFDLSTSNRKESDLKYAKADAVMKQIENISTTKS